MTPDDERKRPPRPGEGRPSDYSEEVVEAICTRLADGESLRSICRDDGFPHRDTVRKWLNRHPEFVAQYARAREAQADALFDEILEIADDGRNDWMIRNGSGDGEPTYEMNHEAMRRSQIRIDARKWMAGKLQPKKYGDKVAHEHSGPNGGPIKTINTDMTAKEAAEAYARTVDGEQG